MAKPKPGTAKLGEIVYRNPAELTPYENNSRKHGKLQVKQLRAIIDQFGFTQPILLRQVISPEVEPRYQIGAGHGRQQAALLDPPLPLVPTIIVTGLNDAQWRALIIADNKIALSAEWNHDMLAAELQALKVEDFEIAVLGFTDGELADLSEPAAPSSGSGSGSGTGNPDSVVCPKCEHEFVPE